MIEPEILLLVIAVFEVAHGVHGSNGNRVCTKTARIVQAILLYFVLKGLWS